MALSTLHMSLLCRVFAARILKRLSGLGPCLCVSPGRGRVCVMVRFPASLAASVGSCDLDTTNDIHPPQTWDLLLVFLRQRGRGEASLSMIQHPVGEASGGCQGALTGLVQELDYPA